MAVTRRRYLAVTSAMFVLLVIALIVQLSVLYI